VNLKKHFKKLLKRWTLALKKGASKISRKSRKKPLRLRETSRPKPQKNPLPQVELEVLSREAALPELSLAQVPVSSAIQEFSLVQLSPHSRRAYAKDLENFFAYLRMQGIWAHWNSEISPLLVAQYREYLLIDRGLAKSTVTRKLAVVKSFCKWALARGWLEKNPAELIRSFPQTQDSKTPYLNTAELTQLLSSFAPIEGTRLFRALSRVTVETLVMLGLRRSEAASIHMKDLERLEGSWVLRVHGKGDRERVLPLPERLLDTWSEWLRRLHPEDCPPASLATNPEHWVKWLKFHSSTALLVSTRSKSFDTPLSTSEIGRIVRQAAHRAGLSNRVTPHALRATAITHALDEGASHRGIQQMAGWTSPLMITRYDKRRKDYRFSAIHHLSYAKNTPPESASNTSDSTPVKSL
jgi:site-specific recombinase XerD